MTNLRSIIKKIRGSTQLRIRLKLHCEVNQEPQILPTLDTKIRWNSLYDCFSECNRIWKSLSSMVAKEEELNLFKLSEEDFEILEDFLNILRPFKKATLDLSSESSVNGSKLFLIMTIIKNHIEKMKNDAAVPKSRYSKYESGFEAMKKKFEKYWQIIEEYSIICHVLDPRFKMEFLGNRVLKNLAMSLIKPKFETYKEKIATREVEEPIEQNLSLIEELIQAKSSTNSLTAGELKMFFETPTINIKLDPIKWWKLNAKAFPVLSKLSLNIIAMMPTSTSSERVFSISALTVTKLRSRLNPLTVKSLMGVYSWNRFQSNFINIHLVFGFFIPD